MKSILILGLGLIGGSLAKAIKESELEYRIYAYDPDQLSLENALNDRSIDEAVDEIETILQIEDLSLIMLCSSIDKTIENLKFLKVIDEKTLFVSLASSLSTINDFVESEGVKILYLRIQFRAHINQVMKMHPQICLIKKMS